MCNYFRDLQPMRIMVLSSIETLLRRNDAVCGDSDETFRWTDFPQVGGRAEMMLEEGVAGMVRASLCLFPLDRAGGAPPEILPIPTVSYLLRDRVSRADGEPPQDVLRQTHAEFGCKKFNYLMKFECQMCPKSWLATPTYKVKDSVEIDVFVESMAAARAFHSKDGTLQWTIESWSRVRQNLLGRFVDSHRSPYFYTDQGYRVQAWISIATGTESSSHREMRRPGRENTADPEDVVVDIVFLTGVNDHRLTKHFPHSTTVTLKNPKHPDQSVVSQSVERDLEQATRYQLVFPAERAIHFDSLLADDGFLLDVVIIKAN